MSGQRDWYPEHHEPRPGPGAFRGLPPVLLVMSVVLLVAAAVALAVATEGGAVPLLFGAVFLLRARGRRRLLPRQYGMARPVERPVAPPPPPPAWPAAKRRYQELQRSYAAFECDPLAVLGMPALTDVTVPSTARWIEALAEAQALDSDHEPPPRHREAFIAAVDRAARAWQAARDAAERLRLSHLTPEERSSVERVVKLLTTAQESDSDAERTTAYARARCELARLERGGRVRLPRPATAALEAAGRCQLPPAR